MKPIYYDVFFKCKELSASLTSSIVSIKVSKKKNNYFDASSTSIKDTYYEVSGKIAAVNEPQENKSNSDVIFIDLASSLFKNT